MVQIIKELLNPARITKATIDNLVLISQALNCSVDYLVGLDTESEDSELLNILHNDPDLKQYVLLIFMRHLRAFLQLREIMVPLSGLRI